MAWICEKCSVAVEEVDDIKLTYGDLDLPDGSGYRCPTCGVELMDSLFVTLQMGPAEQMLEGK